jgi:Ca2+-binding EF-hand superfamily protein
VAALFAVVDQEGNGYITAADVQRLSEQVGDPISLEEAQAMIAASNNTYSSSSSSRRVSQAKFRSVLGPPSP